MADNVILNSGTGGATLAADDIAGIHHQRVKIQYGADGAATDVSDSNPLPIDDAGGSITVDNTDITAIAAAVATEGAALGSGVLLQGDDGTDRKNINVDATTGDVQVDVTNTVTVDGSGVTQPVSGTVTANLSATDNAVLDSIDTAVNGTLTVAAHAVTNAGTFVVQENGAALTALQLIDDSIFADDAAFTTGSSKVTMAGAIRDDSLTTLTAIEGDAVPLRVDSTGALHVTSGGGGGSTQYNEDAAHASGNTGTMALSVRNDVLASLVDTDGDYAPLQVNASGALYTAVSGTVTVDGSGVTQPVSGTVTANLSATDNAVLDAIEADTTTIAGAVSGTEMQVDIVSAPTLTVDLGANNDVTATGNVAHDAVDSGAPIKVGGKAKAFDGTAPGTDVAENDRVDMIATVDGRQYVELTHPNYWNASVDYAVAQTNATVKAAPGAGLKLYITDVIVSNGATAGNITLLDGSGGSVILELYPAANGGLTHSFRTPLALTANTLLAITSTTVTTHSVTVSGFIAA